MRIAVIGNSGSGKSTLARSLAASSGAPVLDLDTVAWASVPESRGGTMPCQLPVEELSGGNRR
jgi:adenylate kinase family enzyme